MTEGYLSKAYTARDADSTRRLYDDWAATYDAEIADNGYATPGRCAAALAEHMADKTVPVLDFGCGTGLSGLALKLAGFTTIDGVDPSGDMLRGAADKDIYRDLSRITPGDPLGHAPGAYGAIAAIGVIGAGAAPLSVFDMIMDSLAPGGRFVWSFNDHALENPDNEAKLQSYLDSGRARLLVRAYGDHLPGIGIGSNVYVIEKT